MGNLEILAGIIGSDGHIKRNKFRLVVVNQDSNFIKSIVLPLIKQITGKAPKPIFNKSAFGGWKFLTFINSPFLWNMLQERFNIPAGKKSGKILPPNLQTNEERLDFISGWFAGDGCVTLFRGRPRLEMWSKSKDFIFWVKEVLKENGVISSVCLIKGKELFFLDIKRLESVKRFHEIINIPHPEKERKLISLLQEYSQTGLNTSN